MDARSLILLLCLTAACTHPASIAPVPRTASPQPAVELVSSNAPNPAVPDRAVDTARQFLDELLGHSFERAAAKLDRAMAASLPPQSLEAAWRSVEGSSPAPPPPDLIEVIPRPPRTHVWFICKFNPKPWNIEIVVNAHNLVSGLRVLPVPPAWTPPDYAKVASFSERRAEVGSPALAGIISMPASPPPYAAVLVHGSGPQDEDASVGPRGAGNKMFKDLAWGLASHGVAVLRYPKRTWAYPEQFEGVAFTLDDEVTRDACEAIQVAAASASVSRNRVVIIAHSLGAALGPRIAANCPGFGGMVLLAGPSRSLDHVLFDQFQYLLAIAGKNREETAAELAELMSGFSLALTPAGASAEQLAFSGMRAPRSYWADVARYEPLAAMHQAPHVPVFVLQGDRDYQVGVSEYRAWKRLLRARPDASCKLYPSLDHRFQAGEGLPTPADYGRPGHVSRQVIEDIATWISQQVGEESRTRPAPIVPCRTRA